MMYVHKTFDLGAMLWSIRYVVPNGISLARLYLVWTVHAQATPWSEFTTSHEHAFNDSPDCTRQWNDAYSTVASLLLAGVLDLFDGAAARKLKAESRIGAILDLVVDAMMWTVIFRLGFSDVTSRYDKHTDHVPDYVIPVIASLVLMLEWNTTLALAYATVFPMIEEDSDRKTSSKLTAPPQPKEEQKHVNWKSGLLQAHTTNTLIDKVVHAYLDRGMRNVLATVGNVSHFVLPVSLYLKRTLACFPTSDDDHEHEESSALQALNGFLVAMVFSSLPGFALYVLVTLKIFLKL